VLLDDVAATTKIKCMLYKDSDDSLVGTTEERVPGLISSPTWETFNFIAPKPDLTAQAYWIVAWADNAAYVQYDSGTATIGFDAETYNDPPNPWFPTEYPNYDLSIFCNYTVAGGEAYYALTSTWQTALEWDAITDLSQAFATSWVVDIVHTIGANQYYVDLSQAIATTWTILTQWNGIIDLTQTFGTIWTVIIQTDFITALTQTFTTSWLVEAVVGAWQAFNVDLTLNIVTSWIVDVVHTLWISPEVTTFGTLALVIGIIALAIAVTAFAAKTKD